MKHFHYLLFGSLFSYCSCSTTKKTIPASEVPPVVVRSLPSLPSSQINIPIKLYLRSLLATMDSSTSKVFTSEKWPDYYQSSCDFRYKYRFVRSPFTFSCINNKVNIFFRGHYQIAGSRSVCVLDKQVSPWVSGSCGFDNEPLRRVDVNISSVLELLPAHQLRTTTRLEKLTPLDKCAVTLLKNDVTAEIMDSIKASVETYTAAFDNFVQTLNNNVLLNQWRSGKTRVMPVSKYGFLNLNPVSLRVGKFTYLRDTLVFSVGFNGNPQFSSDSMKLLSSTELPDVIVTENDHGIRTYLNAVYEYKFFNQLLNDSLRNRPFEVEGRTFVIKEINISGSNTGKINIDVSFTGNRKGVLHLSGTPLLDTATQVVSMPDISFSLDTRDMFVNMAKALFRKKIMKTLKNQSVLDLAALIERNKSKIDARLNQPVTPWMSTRGNFREFRLIGLLPQKDYLQIQVYINANLTLIGHPPSSMISGNF